MWLFMLPSLGLFARQQEIPDTKTVLLKLLQNLTNPSGTSHDPKPQIQISNSCLRSPSSPESTGLHVFLPWGMQLRHSVLSELLALCPAQWTLPQSPRSSCYWYNARERQKRTEAIGVPVGLLDFQLSLRFRAVLGVTMGWPHTHEGFRGP